MSLTDQPPPPAAPRRSPLRAILPYTSAAVVIAALWAGWTVYSRHAAEKKAEAQALEEKQAEQKRIDEKIFGSGEVSFTTFEAADGVLKRGQKTELCYGVVNATSVKLDPPVEPIKPSYRHCLEISPLKTTTYTITAEDGAGHSKTSTLTVRVK